MRRILAVIGAVALAAALAFPAQAKPAGPSPWHLVYDSYQPGPNPDQPSSCMTADDAEFAYFSGSLTGASSWNPQRLCDGTDFSVIYWTAGNVGMRVDAFVTAADNTDPVDVWITSPSGGHFGALLVSTEQLTGSSHGKTRYHYQACVLPGWAGDTHHPSLEGGVWAFNISGSWSDTNYYATAGSIPTTECPTPNFLP